MAAPSWMEQSVNVGDVLSLLVPFGSGLEFGVALPQRLSER